MEERACVDGVIILILTQEKVRVDVRRFVKIGRPGYKGTSRCVAMCGLCIAGLNTYSTYISVCLYLHVHWIAGVIKGAYSRAVTRLQVEI